jgi:hypothetical protein
MFPSRIEDILNKSIDYYNTFGIPDYSSSRKIIAPA